MPFHTLQTKLFASICKHIPQKRSPVAYIVTTTTFIPKAFQSLNQKITCRNHAQKPIPSL